MDLIAKRFEARYLETEGKPQAALALYREIIAHFEQEPAREDLLPVYLKASELTLKLGDRPAAIAILVRAAEHLADHGVVPPVIELCQRLPRLDPGLSRLHLRFARRMLERGHVAPACDLLRDLALRRKKTALRQTLERMATWPEPIVRGQLLEFLDRAESRQRAAAPAPEPPPAPAVPAPEPLPVPAAPAPPATAPPAPVAAPEPAPPPAPPPQPAVPPHHPPPLPPRDVEFIEAPSSAPRPAPLPTRSTGIQPMVPAPRRRRHRSIPWLNIAAAGALVALGAWLGSRFLRSEPQVVASPLSAPGPAEPAPPVPDPVTATDTGTGAPLTLAQRDTPAVSVPVTEPARDVTPAAAAVVPAPLPQSREPVRSASQTARPVPTDTARPVVREPELEPSPAADTRPEILRVEYAVVLVEGLDAVSVGIEGDGSSRRVVVRQLLPGGDTLELRAADLGAGSVGVGGGRILVSPHPSGGAMGTARVGQFLVTARAPLAPEALEPLLRRLVEVRP